MMSFHISKLPVVPICVIGIHPRDQETSAARRQSSQRTNKRQARQAGGGPCAGKGAITQRERNLNSLPNIWISSSSRKQFISPWVRRTRSCCFVLKLK